MRKFFAFILLAAAPALSDTHTPPHDPDEGMEGSIRLGIPEPMVFDLVRPLGAAKGEFEINSLFRHASRDFGRMLWAPEIEFAFANGSAVEFELPMSGWVVEDYKVGLQQTLPARRSKRFTHGLQGLGEVSREKPLWQATGLYIAGVRWYPQWSTLSMVGAVHENNDGRRATLPLINHALFHERWKRTAVGVELNLKDPRRSRSEWLVMPQLHFRLVEKINLQVGTGYTQRAGSSSPVVSWRLIREL